MTKPEKYIVWDLETSGFISTKDKILEIGMMLIEGDEVKEKKTWTLNHNIDIPEKITAINGMTKEKCTAEGRDPKECIVEFLSHIKDLPHITHNGIAFDIPFLMGNAIELLEMNDITRQLTEDNLYNNAIDTAVFIKAKKLGMDRFETETFRDWAKRVMSIRAVGVKYNLQLALEEMGIATEGHTLHRALTDVHFTNEVFKKLLA